MKRLKDIKVERTKNIDVLFLFFYCLNIKYNKWV